MRGSAFVMAALVAAIHVFDGATLLRRGCPDKPGHDNGEAGHDGG